MKNSLLQYSIGALLYCPANNDSVAQSVISERFGKKYSLALCLEDTIGDSFVEEAENIMISSLRKIFSENQTRNFFIPKIFIRVRSPKQILRLTEKLQDEIQLVKGFILPKFSLENADKYLDTVKAVNKSTAHQFYIMPIFESPDIINLNDRYDILYTLKEKLDAVEDIVLNIRVGGNDLCHKFGFRRSSYQSIHEIRAISSILSDIVTVFGMDYVISGPVWEYYGGKNWKEGLQKELSDDRLCGFVGKTVIHPNQIEIVNSAYMVSKKSYNDALLIMGWDKNSNSLVCGNSNNERMNEYKTHYNWAEKILFLAEAFGIKD